MLCEPLVRLWILSAERNMSGDEIGAIHFSWRSVMALVRLPVTFR